MRRHFVITFVIWFVLTAVGESLALLNLFPTVGSTEAGDFDRIFRLLLQMGTPVFTFVLAVLFYSFYAFRSRGTPAEDGPAYRGTGSIPRVWIAVTGSLAALTMIYPGLTGLADLQANKSGYGWGDPNAEFVIKVTAFRWAWSMEYVDAGVTVTSAKDPYLVLPINTPVRFEINSTDVVHSLWIPAFRMRIDTLPGRTTFMTVNPDKLGTYDDDQAFRVQCSALCGLNHATMRFPIRVVSQDDFQTWLASQKPASQTAK